MIPNVTRGGKTHGVLLYLVGKGKREEHENPHLIAGSPEAIRMGEASKQLERSDAVRLARFLDEPREAFGTKVTIAERGKNGRLTGTRDAHVWHCSLSLHPQEPELADDRWGEIAEAFVEHVAASQMKVIAFVSSRMGSIALNTTGGSYAYRSSKAGLNAVVKGLAIDLQPRHILVLALHPGWAKTEPEARVDVDRSVSGMRAVIERCSRHETGCFFAFNDTMLPW